MKKMIIIMAYWLMMFSVRGQQNITRVEYFFNTDPGFGNGINIPVTPAADLSDINFSANIASLSLGLNSLFIRSRSAIGNWSISNRWLFVKQSATSNVPNINRVEYFFDTDPGFGNGVGIPVTAAPDISNNVAVINLSGVNNGLHSLFIRSRDTDGKWSVTNRWLFIKQSATSNAPNINRVEYFFDTDPGFGNGTNIPVAASADIVNAVAPINLTGLNDGLHSMYIRTRDTDGKWSLSNRWLFIKQSASANPYEISFVEYYIDTDPGFGNAVPVAINASTNLPDEVTVVNITDLAAGTHRLFIRSKDNNGKWSVTNEYDFPIASLVAPPEIVVNSVTNNTLCGGSDFNLSYHPTGTFNPGNVFNVQLSNAAGSFAAPIVIGSFTGTGSSIIKSTIPLHIANGTQYRVRVVSTNPVVTGLTGVDIFTLRDQPRFSDSTVFIVCANETVNLNSVFNTTGFTVEWNTITPTTAGAGVYQLITTNNVCRDTAIVTVKQDVITWTGSINNDWHNPGNWNVSRVPDQKSHVIINSGTVNVSAANADAASVQVKVTQTLNIQPGRTLTIHAKCNPLPTGL